MKDDSLLEKGEIKSVIKTFKVFELLTQNDSMNIKSIDDATHYGKSTIHRILATLKLLGYVSQDQHGDYFATLKMFFLSNEVRHRYAVVSLARPFLEELFDRFHETVNIAVVDNGQLVFLDKILTSEPLRIELTVGTRLPFYCTGLGKAIYSFRPQNELNLNAVQFTQFTTNTITTTEALLREFELIRQKGYSIDDEEYIYGLRCIAVPLLDKTGYAVAALSIAVPYLRYSAEREQEMAERLKDAANKIAAMLQ